MFDRDYGLRAEAFNRRPDNLGILREAYRLAGSPKTLLDIGCNTGVSIRHLHQNFDLARATGLDVNQWAVAAATKDNPDPTKFKFQAYQGQLSDVSSLKPWGFKGVLLSHTLSHIYPTRVPTLLTQVRYKLHPGGKLIIITPSKLYDWMMRPVNLFNGYKSDPTIQRLYSITDLRHLLALNGYRVTHAYKRGEHLPYFKSECTRAMTIVIAEV